MVETLLFAYFSGQITEQEEKELTQWLEADEANKKILKEMTDWWAISHVPLFMSDRESNFKKHFANLTNINQTQGKQKFIYYSFAGRIAAAIVVLLLVGVSFYYIGRNTQTVNRETAYYETVVPLGSKTKVMLPDESIVWINAGSTLKYCDNTATNQREVILEGEAYFEVTRDSLKPFVIKSGNLDIKVIGTNFNVRAYSDEEIIDVALISGKVDIFSDNTISENNNVTLAPNQMLSYNKKTDDMQVSAVYSQDYCTWKDGYLKFTEQSFMRIAKDLERKYNVRIETKSNLLKKEFFSGSFSDDQTLNDIFREIDVDKKYKWIQTATTFIIEDK